jgi:hypothetical protein
MNANYLLRLKREISRLFLLMTMGLFLAGVPTTFAAVTTPVRNAGTGTNVTGVGTVAWTSPGNVISDNNSYATVAVSGGAISNYLQATNFGFSIPTEATITGITVTIGRFESATGTGTDVRDNVVQLIKGGVVTGTNLAVTGTDWPTTETALAYGGTTNLWGNTLTPADINASNFGVALAVTSSNSRTASVDYMQIQVTYNGTYLSQFTAMNTGASIWCAGETRTVTVTLKNNGSVTWTDTWPDINIGVKWDAEADYIVRTDANNLAPGETQTYSLTMTAPSAGSTHLTFDVVYELLSWFGNNGGGVGPGNTVYTSPAITIITGVPAQPSTITGNTTPCFGTSQTYSVTNVAGVTYNWTFPGGWTQTGGGTSNSVTVTVGANSGSITVTPSNACGNGTARTLGVTPSVPATPTTTGASICTNNTATLSASGAVSGDKYKWYDAASGGTLLKTSTNNTDNTFTTPNLTLTTNYWVAILKASGCEGPRALATAIVSNPVSIVNGQSNVSCFGGNDGTITIHASGGIAPYSYSVDNGLTWVSSGTDPYSYGTLVANTAYKIRVKDSIGCQSPAIP